MSKRLIILIVAIGVFGLLTYLGFNVILKAKEKNKISKRLEIIPEFQFLTLEKKPFTKANLKLNLNTIFIYFNSECVFCQSEAQSISDNLDSFKIMQLIFVSTESIVTIKQFSERYNLNNKQNITFLYDNNDSFSNIFYATSIPYVLIYDQNQKLIKKNKGKLNANGILRALKQND